MLLWLCLLSALPPLPSQSAPLPACSPQTIATITCYDCLVRLVRAPDLVHGAACYHAPGAAGLPVTTPRSPVQHARGPRVESLALRARETAPTSAGTASWRIVPERRTM